ncbi:helix-turn-helix domain-containing protein [Bermanella marisrubri]|uniref:Putative regulatory protein n=1 Tax=Bermanella marisrubri TaxID=207949 RepID=Q1N5T0_9GAMM|nr:AraC family transcriptional regulator [Bermanella marisrubri]EAT13862.1 putative regulatory protein [Oceanobacter sp. RED65] [Bermanella marisrubri]
MMLYIKNMVCNRCIMIVQQVLTDLNIAYDNITLGEVVLSAELSDDKIQALDAELLKYGFERLNASKSVWVDQLKVACIQYLNDQVHQREKLSDYVRRHVHRDYQYLSHLFSSIEGMTLEQYFIRLRIEKAKEMLAYGQDTLAEIAFQLGFSSTAHLSGQFKKVTGLTPSHFRNARHKQERVPLDNL